MTSSPRSSKRRASTGPGAPKLGGVHFVRDYVEFYFDGPVVRSLADPILRDASGERLRFPAPGSRDALCALIGRRLVAAAVRDDEAIRLRFDGGAEVIINAFPDRGFTP